METSNPPLILLFLTLSPNNSMHLVQIYNKNYETGAKDEEIKAVAIENQKYHDMLLPNVEDNYHTVGLKMFSAFHWIMQLRNNTDLKWIMKIDDDIMVNFTRLDTYLSKENINHQAIHCPVHPSKKVMRDPKTKW